MGKSSTVNASDKGDEPILYALQPRYTNEQREWLKEHYPEATKPGKKLYDVVHNAITMLREAELWTEEDQVAYQVRTCAVCLFVFTSALHDTVATYVHLLNAAYRIKSWLQWTRRMVCLETTLEG